MAEGKRSGMKERERYIDEREVGSIIHYMYIDVCTCSYIHQTEPLEKLRSSVVLAL